MVSALIIVVRIKKPQSSNNNIRRKICKGNRKQINSKFFDYLSEIENAAIW